MPGPFVTLEVSEPEFESDGLRHATVFSRALGRRGDCTYWRPADSEEALPLVILLHGVYGSHWAWAHKAGAHRIARSLIEAGDIPPIALAMPSDGLWGLGSGYIGHPGGDFESWIIDEVPALVAEVDPAMTADAPLGLAGLSMGGFGALLLGARHADRVRGVAGLSSITAFEQMALFVGPLDRYETDPAAHVVADELVARRDTVPSLHLSCGVDDLLIEHNRALHEKLTAEGIEHEYDEHPGGHEWAYWSTHLPAALRSITRAF